MAQIQGQTAYVTPEKPGGNQDRYNHVAPNQYTQEAHNQIEHRKNSLHEKVITVFQQCGPLIAEQVSLMIDGNYDNRNTWSPRVTELAQIGILIEVGNTRTRCGRRATLYNLRGGDRGKGGGLPKPRP